MSGIDKGVKGRNITASDVYLGFATLNLFIGIIEILYDAFPGNLLMVFPLLGLAELTNAKRP